MLAVYVGSAAYACWFALPRNAQDNELITSVDAFGWLWKSEADRRAGKAKARSTHGSRIARRTRRTLGRCSR